MKPLSRPHSVPRPTAEQVLAIRRESQRLGIEEPRVLTRSDASKALRRLRQHRQMKPQLRLAI